MSTGSRPVPIDIVYQCAPLDSALRQRCLLPRLTPTTIGIPAADTQCMLSYLSYGCANLARDRYCSDSPTQVLFIGCRHRLLEGQYAGRSSSLPRADRTSSHFFSIYIDTTHGATGNCRTWLPSVHLREPGTTNDSDWALGSR